MDEHWLHVGRDLAGKAVGLGRKERLALVRQRAHELERSPHSIGRFLALAEFLAPFELDGTIQEQLPLGVIEVIQRVHLKDPSIAQDMLDETIKKGMTYREALKRIEDLTNSIKDTDERSNYRPDKAIYMDIVATLGMYTVRDLKFECLGGYKWCLSSVSSSWKIVGLDLALVSEADTIYSFNRGFKNFARNVFLANNEYDHVLVEFVSHTSWMHFFNYCQHIKKNADVVVKLHGFADGEIRPDRKAWAHLTKKDTEA